MEDVIPRVVAELAVWLLGQAGLVVEGGYLCPGCGCKVEGPWPHPGCQAKVTWCKGPYHDYAFVREDMSEVLVPAGYVERLLELIELAKIARCAGWQTQLKDAYEKYEGDLREAAPSVGGEQPELGAQEVDEACRLVKLALLRWQQEHCGRPVTVTRLFRDEPELCGAAAKLLQSDNSRKTLHTILAGQYPHVLNGKPEQGHPTWTMASQFLVESAIIKDPVIAARDLEEAQVKLEALVREYLVEKGKKTWQLRQLLLWRPQAFEELVAATGSGEGPKGLAVLFGKSRDTFCVTGRSMGAAVWAFTEEALELELARHDQQFARFSGQKGK